VVHHWIVIGSEIWPNTRAPMEPHGQSPWYLGQRPCGATFPDYHRDGRSHDGAFLFPVSIGGSPAAGMTHAREKSKDID